MDQVAELRRSAQALDPASQATVDELIGLALAAAALQRSWVDRHRLTERFDVEVVTNDADAIRIRAWAEFSNLDGTHWTPVELTVEHGTRALTLRTAAAEHDLPDGVPGPALAGAEINWQRAAYLAT